MKGAATIGVASTIAYCRAATAIGAFTLMMLIKESGRGVLEVEFEHCIGYMIMFFAVEAAFCKEI